MKIAKFVVFVLIAGLFVLAACQPTPSTATNAPATPKIVTATPAQLPTAALPTVTPANLATASPADTATAAPVLVPALPDYSAGAYLDDRSTPAALILSYANAINRHEYIRAYSYWSNPSNTLGTLDAFTAKYANTTSEAVSFGHVTAEGAAGSVYYTVPTALTDTLSSGTAKFAVCYILRFPQPGNYGAPPIQPLHFDQYTVTPVSSSMNDDDTINSACTGTNLVVGLPTSAAVTESLGDLSANNYIDNRSGAVEVVSSLLNALNKKEYVRAYSYWQDPATAPGNYDTYAAGFADTALVTATFGTVTSDAGAGNYYYQIPLAMFVTKTNNNKTTFVGCYTLHIANPGIQGTLPFQPLGIKTGKFTQVANNVNVVPLLATACN